MQRDDSVKRDEPRATPTTGAAHKAVRLHGEEGERSPSYQQKRDREFVQPDGTSEVARKTNPERSNEHPVQTAEVPLGTGSHPEPPGGGGRASQRVGPDDTAHEPLNPGDEASPDAPGAREDVCRACHGAGTVEGRQCMVCGGIGKVVQGIA